MMPNKRALNAARKAEIAYRAAERDKLERREQARRRCLYRQRCIRLTRLDFNSATDRFHADYLAAQLARFDGNVRRTAEFIGMDRTSLHRKMRALGIERAV